MFNAGCLMAIHSSFPLEYTIIKCTSSYLRQDLERIFPALKEERDRTAAVIFTFQPSKVDLSGAGFEVEEEKERLYEKVVKIPKLL